MAYEICRCQVNRRVYLKEGVVASEWDCENLSGQAIDPVLLWVDAIEPPKEVREHFWLGRRYFRYKTPSEALWFLRSRPDTKAITSMGVRAADCHAVLGYVRDLFRLNEVEDAARIEVLLRLIGDVPHGVITKFRSLGAEVRWA